MRIRRAIIIVPLVCGLVAWILNSIEPARTWTELKEAWGIVNQEEFTIAAVLGVALVGFTLVLRILRDTSGD